MRQLIQQSFPRVLAGLVALVLVACGSQPPVADSQRQLEVDYDYVVGPGDSLEIFVWGNTELTTTGVVRPDGKLTTRLVEDMEASGKTSTQLARDIEQVYSNYVNAPVVSVIVNGFVGVPTQQVRVVGQATDPTAVPFRKHMTLLDVMIQVGGITQFAAGNRAVLVRNVGGRQQSFGVKLDSLLRDGDISANITMFPGDIIIIPEAWF